MEPAGALAVRTRGGCSYKIATPGGKPVAFGRGLWARRSRKAYSSGCSAPALRLRCLRAYVGEPVQRSEEHTSELQSRPHLVCRLLLEKKKNKKCCNLYEAKNLGNVVTLLQLAHLQYIYISIPYTYNNLLCPHNYVEAF